MSMKAMIFLNLSTACDGAKCRSRTPSVFNPTEALAQGLVAAPLWRESASNLTPGHTMRSAAKKQRSTVMYPGELRKITSLGVWEPIGTIRRTLKVTDGGQ